jgi:hypothetical protein
LDLATGRVKRVRQSARQFGGEIGVVGGDQPGYGHARRLAERGCGGNKRMRRANFVLAVVGMTAAARRKSNDRSDLARIARSERQRAPAAGGMADHDRALRPHKWLRAHEVQRRRDFIGRSAARVEIVDLVATALVFQIGPNGRAVARAFRHQHGKAAAHQKRGQRPIFRLRHLRTTQHILRRSMRDHRQPERPLTLRAKQDRVRGDRRVTRRHQPRLRA